MKTIIKYIIEFLLGEQNVHLADQIEYANNSNAKIKIVPSDFFDDNIYMTQGSIPKLPLKEIDDVPLLFGNEDVVWDDGQLVISADIIASAFFLLTRYEEYVNHEDRDEYGRLRGVKSLPYRAGFLMRPIVDEYGRLLRKWMRSAGFCVEEPQNNYNHIYLTHDVDCIWRVKNLYRAVRMVCGKFLRREEDKFESIKSWCNYKRYDRFYTFPWLIEKDNDVKKYLGKDLCTSVYFIKTGGTAGQDDAYYRNTSRVKDLIHFLKKSGAVLGLHASFSAGEIPERIFGEKEKLEKLSGEKIRWNRNHYLCSREPEDFRALIKAGITDDFTMGYADAVGFRLGTCRDVKWIDPVLKKITPLTLHPLTIMECTLDYEGYMNLNEDEAENVVKQMLCTVKRFHGEVVLLWHNTSVADSSESYQRKLYEKTLRFLKCDSIEERENA